MKRKLLRQIATEWRSNLWIAIELLAVSVVLWYVADYLTVQATILSYDMGLDTENCYSVDIAYINEDNEAYDPSDSTVTAFGNNRDLFLDRLKAFPGIETVALQRSCGIPYWQMSWDVSLSRTDGNDTTIIAYPSMRIVSPEYVKLFAIKGLNGETPDELAEVLASGRAIVSSNSVILKGLSAESIRQGYAEGPIKHPEEFIGKAFLCEAYSPTDSIRIGAFIKPIKRLEYELPEQNLLLPFKPEADYNLRWGLLVRVKPDYVEKFEQRLMDASEESLRVGNFYVSNVVPLSTIRDTNQAEYRDSVVNHIVIMIFLLVSIFLGLLGTFWFRTQQRVSEIAIRKVNGASSTMVMRRLMGEGLLILTIVTPLAVLFDWLLCHFNLNEFLNLDGSDPYFTGWRFSIAVAATYLLMALMIVLGIWFPASRAMRIDPALALKDE